jgi:hypothetical protein
MNALEIHGISRTAGRSQERLSARSSSASLGSAMHCPMSPTPTLSGRSCLRPHASPESISWEARAHEPLRNSLTLQQATHQVRRQSRQSLTVPKARRSGTRAPARVPQISQGRRRTRSTTGVPSWPLPPASVARQPLGKLPIISRRCSRSHARTTPSPSSTCTRTAPS